MKPFRTPSFALAAAALLTAMTSVASAQVSYTGGLYTQNFDGLSSTATSTAPDAFTDNVTLLGWYAQAIATDLGATYSAPFVFTMVGDLNPQADDYQASPGTGTSGDLYSFGAAGSTERALGTLASGSSDTIFIGLRIQNNTAGPITRFTLTYDGEQWRRGGTNATQRTESLQVFYRVGGTDFIGSTGWTEETKLKFTTPVSTDSTAAALDGNLAANRVQGISAEVILSTPLAVGDSLWITWVDTNYANTDHGMAIDNVVFSAVTSTGSNISIGSGFTFTPSSLGGNAFAAGDTAIFDGTPGAVAVVGAVEAAGLSFVNSGYSLTGGAGDSLAVSGTVLVNDGTSASISAILAGDDGLTKTGAGSLTLTGSNTFTGSVAIKAGTLIVSGDANFGAADNDISLDGTLVTSASSLALGSGRTFSGSGTIQTAAAGSLSFAGPVAAGNLTLSGPTTINFGGTTNSVGTLSLAVPTAINVTGGALEMSGLALAQTSGTTTVTGPVSFATGDKLIPVPGGTLVFNGAVTNGSTRLQKTGAGTLDLTSATVSGSGTLRIGVVSSDLVNQGGLVVIDEGSDLGTTQMHFNSGTLQATAPIVSSAGVSIGGRRSYDAPAFSSVLPVPTFVGADITLTGASSFFNSTSAPASDQAIAVNTNNTTRLNGTFAVGNSGQWVMLGGSGTLVFGGNASAMANNFLTADAITLQVDGQFGAAILEVSSETTLAGSGTLTGWVTTTTVTTGTPPNTTTTTTVTYHQESEVWIRGGTLAPTGLLTVNAALKLEGTTELDISGITRGTEYDSVALINPDAAGSVSFNLGYGGILKLNFPLSALNGTYTLFEIGATYVTRSGSFSSVELTGSHTGSLTNSGGVWSGTVSGVTFGFDESTGVLTITGAGPTLSPIEQWRLTNFGVSTNTGTAADSADFDNDGIPNLIEYATGTEPDAFNASAVVQGRDGDYLTLSYTKISDASLTYTVTATSDLAAAFTTGTGATNEAGGITTYKDDVSLSTAGVRRFLRLEVTRTE